MMVAAVDDNHLDGRSSQNLRRRKAGKASADNKYLHPTF
jgi:hypothetical protein